MFECRFEAELRSVQQRRMRGIGDSVTGRCVYRAILPEHPGSRHPQTVRAVRFRQRSRPLSETTPRRRSLQPQPHLQATGHCHQVRDEPIPTPGEYQAQQHGEPRDEGYQHGSQGPTKIQSLPRTSIANDLRNKAIAGHQICGVQYRTARDPRTLNQLPSGSQDDSHATPRWLRICSGPRERPFAPADHPHEIPHCQKS